MKEIYKLEKYSVCLLKKDDCCGTVESFLNENETLSDFIFLILVVPLCIYLYLFYFIFGRFPDLFTRKCGVEVSIRNGLSCGNIIYTRYYQFSGNQEKDAIEVNKIIEELKNKVNDLITKEKEIERIKMEKKENEEKRKKECCDYYKNVVEKIGGVKL